jgi:hypothetical protein
MSRCSAIPQAVPGELSDKPRSTFRAEDSQRLDELRYFGFWSTVTLTSVNTTIECPAAHMTTRNLLLMIGLMSGLMQSTCSADSLKVTCEGQYAHHLQGICADEHAIYWSFTTQLVKTDRQGKLLSKIPVANHHGDLCLHNGRLCVAVNLGKFNDPEGNADSWVYVYNPEDLSLVSKHATPQVIYGAGGVGSQNGRLFVVGGLPDKINENYVYEYDLAGELKFVQKHVIKSGHTHLGIQTATFADDRWMFGCYGTPKILLVTDAAFNMLGRYEYDCSLGIESLPDGRFLSASGRCEKSGGCIGVAHLTIADPSTGLKHLED